MEEKDTRQEILKSAVELFARNGYAETSMSSISRNTGVSKGTLYWHFSSKEDLFREIIESGFNCIARKIDQIVREDRPAEDLIYDYIAIHYDFIEDNKKLAKIIWDNIDKVISKDFRENMEEKRQHVRSSVEILVKKGIDSGVLREMDQDIMVLYLVNIITVIHEEEFMDMGLGHRQKLDILYQIILNGIGKGGAASV